MNFTFDGKIEKEVLENYLSRAVTASYLHETSTLEDDLRVIGRLGIKFLGRASGVWAMSEADEVHFAKSAYLAQRVHEQDPEIILQACIFEWVTTMVETVRIPDYVQKAFGLIPEDRCFCLADMLFENEQNMNPDSGIPDLNRLETRMWFYTELPVISIVDMKHFIWGRCICILRMTEVLQRQLNFSK